MISLLYIWDLLWGVLQSTIWYCLGININTAHFIVDDDNEVRAQATFVSSIEIMAVSQAA